MYFYVERKLCEKYKYSETGNKIKCLSMRNINKLTNKLESGL